MADLDNMKTTDNLSYDQNCCPISDHTNVIHNLLSLDGEEPGYEATWTFYKE